MADEPDNLILLHLREIRADISAMRSTLSEHTTRLGRVETMLAGIKRDVADVHMATAEHSARLDRFENRLEKIEKRLGLVEA